MQETILKNGRQYPSHPVLLKFNNVHWLTWGLDGELELVEELCEEEGVGQRLPHLHDPHNGRVNLYT
jgi:hypothetical protein